MSNDNQNPIPFLPPPIPLAPKGKLAAALAKAQMTLKSPTKGHKVDYKDKSGREIKYSYADLSDCIEALKEPLSSNGLSYMQTLEFKRIGNAMVYGLVTTLMHESGEFADSFHPLPEPGQSRPQEFGSALTYARRYSISAITGMASEEDDDGAMATKGIDTNKNQNKGASAPSKAGQNEQKGSNTGQAPTQKPITPDNYVMPIGSKDVKGKALGVLPTNVLGQILASAESSLAKNPDDRGWKLIKANVELVIKSRSKKEKEPDLNDVFPPEDDSPGPDIENYSQEEKEKKPQPEDYILPDSFGVDGIAGKALRSIPEKQLRQVIKNIDTAMKTTPPPGNVGELFGIRNHIVLFFKSMDLKV